MSHFPRSYRHFLRLALAVLALLGAGPACAAFTDNGDGTVTDSATGLMWDKCSWGQSGNTNCATGSASSHTWPQALGVAVTANAMNGGAGYKGHNDWRLPNRAELESLVKIDSFSPAIDATAFPNTVADWYWTSTLYTPDPAYAWIVYFDNGFTSADYLDSNDHVRLVRSGQSFGSFDSLGDFIPNAFSFTAQTGVALSTVATSSAAQIAGIDTAANWSASNGSACVSSANGCACDVATWAASGTVSNNQYLCVRQTSSGSFSTLTTATLTVGGVAGAFDVTTLASDTTPNAFSFTAQTGVALSTLTTSNAAQIAGINTAANWSASNGTACVSSANGCACNVSGWATSGTVSNSQYMCVRQTSSGSYSTTSTATLAVGGVNGSFSVTTVAGPAVVTSYTAPSATGSGSITASFTGGGAACTYTVSRYLPVSGIATPPPAGLVFPHGLFDFTASSCTAGLTLSFTITYPQALPPGTQYWKYGPTPGDGSYHWYVLPASIVGNTATFTITDGGPGDDDLTANGTIVDQGGAGLGGAASIPTLSEWGMILLSGLLAVFGRVQMRRRNG